MWPAGAALFRPLRRSALRDDGGVSSSAPTHLAILPGLPFALFLVRVGAARQVLAVHATQFLRGLRVAADLLSFSELQRDEAPLEELLPWAGNV
jgi:hypothetical protein